ncbi:MAG: hydrogenase maturation protein [Planctomycetota bacterium]
MSCCGPDRCATCGDIADRATIRSIEGADAACVLESGEEITAAIDLVPGALVGRVLLVHQGVAIGMERRSGEEAVG